MKKFAQILLLALGVAGLGAACLAAEQKIATFNLRKVFDKYYKTIQSTTVLKQEAGDVEKERAQMMEAYKKHQDQWRALIDAANDQAVSAEAREKSKKAAEEKLADVKTDEQSINDFERVATTRLREKERQRRDDIVKEIEGVVDAHAKAGAYSLVLDTSGESANMTPVVLYSGGQDDLTDVILKELNAAAPPGLLDTNAPAAASTNAANPPK